MRRRWVAAPGSPDLADLLPTLGAVDAMCLDSGASCGLWYAGALVTEPGRDLSYALVITAND